MIQSFGLWWDSHLDWTVLEVLRLVWWLGGDRGVTGTYFSWWWDPRHCAALFNISFIQVVACSRKCQNSNPFSKPCFSFMAFWRWMIGTCTTWNSLRNHIKSVIPGTYIVMKPKWRMADLCWLSLSCCSFIRGTHTRCERKWHRLGYMITSSKNDYSLTAFWYSWLANLYFIDWCR